MEPQLAELDLTLPPDVDMVGETRGIAPQVRGVTAGMPRLLDTKGRPIENPPVTADSSTQEEGIPDRPSMEEFGFDPETMRDISEPQRTTLSDLDALADRILAIEKMPIKDLVQEFGIDVPSVENMSIDELLGKVSSEDALMYSSAQTEEEQSYIEGELRSALQDTIGQESLDESAFDEESLREQLGRRVTEQANLDKRKAFALSNKELIATDTGADGVVNPEELAQLVDTKRAKLARTESMKHAEVLDQNREEAESVADSINEAGIPYLKRKKKGKDPGWSVYAVEPGEGRVYAQYEMANGDTYVVSWKIDEPAGTVTHARTAAGELLRDKTNKGLQMQQKASTGKSSGKPFLDSLGEPLLREGGGVPVEFRQQVNALATAALIGPDGVIRTPVRGKAGGVTAKIVFEGSKPASMVAKEAARQAEKQYRAQLGRYEKADQEEIVRIREAAKKGSAVVQGTVEDFVKQRAIDQGGELVTPTRRIPAIKQDRGGAPINLIEKEAMDRLLRTESAEETVTQILPDGAIRTVKIRLTEDGTSYEAFAVSRGINEFTEPFPMGRLKIKVNQNKLEEARAASKDAERSARARARAKEESVTEAQREFKLESDRRTGQASIKSRAAGRTRSSAQGDGRTVVITEKARDEAQSAVLNQVKAVVRKVKQKANDPTTGKFLSVPAHELKAKARELLSLMRAGVDKATPIDERGGQITTEYVDGRVIQLLFGNVSSVDNLSREELREIYQSEEYAAAVEQAQTEIESEFRDLTDREQQIMDEVPGAKEQIDSMVESGMDWENALDVFLPGKEAVLKRTERKAESKRRKAVKQTLEKRLEVQLDRRGRLRPTAEEGPQENLAVKAVKALEDSLTKKAKADAKLLADQAKVNQKTDIETRKQLEDIGKRVDLSAEQKLEQQVAIIDNKEQIAKLAEIIEQDKLARQMERLQDQAAAAEREQAREDAGIGVPVQEELGLPEVFDEPPVTMAETAEVPLSPPQIARAKKAEAVAAEKLRVEQVKAAKRRARAQKKKDSESILKLYGLRDFGKASSWSSIGKDIAVREGQTYLKDSGISVKQIDPETKRELQWDQDFALGMQEVMARAWRNATPEQQAQSTPDPTPEHVEAASETLDLNSEDITEVETWIARNFSRPRYYARKIRGYFTHGRGLSKLDGTREVIKFIEEQQAAGKQLLAEMSDAWLLFEGQVREDGWGKKLTDPQELAINAFLQGMGRSSIEKAHGVVFSEKAIDKLNIVKAKLREASVDAKDSGVFVKSKIKRVITKGRPYLHATAARPKPKLWRKLLKKQRVTPREIAMLHNAAVEAWDLPTTEEQINEMKLGALKKLVNKHSIYTEGVPNEDLENEESWAYIERDDGSKVYLYKIRETLGEKLKWRDDLDVEDLRQFVKNVEITDEVIDGMIEEMVNNIITGDTSRIGGTVAGTNTSIQQERRYLKPDMQVIFGVMKSVTKTLEKKKKPTATDTMQLERLKLNRDRYEAMSVEEFLDVFETEHPEYKALLDKTRKSHNLNIAMRDVLQQVTQSEFLVADTFRRLTEETMLSRTLSETAELGIDLGWASLTPDPKKQLVRMAEKGTPLGRTNFKVNGSTVNGSQLWIDENVRDAFVAHTGGNQREAGKFSKFMYGLSGLSKYGMVIASPLAQARNFSSSALIHAGNGGFLGPRSFWDATTAAGSQLRASLSKTQNIKVAQTQRKRSKWLVDNMNRLGLLHDGSLTGALEDVFKGLNSEEDVFALSNEFTQTGHYVGQAGGRTKTALRWAGRVQGTAFRLEDEAIKGAALTMQTRQYLMLHGEDSGILNKAMNGESLTAEEQEVLEHALKVTAEHVKNTYPTFSRTAQWVKSLSRVPIIGAFPAFSYEMIRNSMHHYTSSLMLMSGHTPDGRKIKGTNQQLTAMGLGVVNMASRTALLVGAAMLANFFSELVGFREDDDEPLEPAAIAVGRLVTGSDETQNKFNSILPWYEKHGSNYVYSINRETREMEYSVLDYLFPMGGIQKAIVDNWQTNRDLLAKGDPRLIRMTAKGVVGSFADVFLNDEVLYGSTMKRYGEKGVPEAKPDARLSKVMGNWVEKQVQDAAEFIVPDSAAGESVGAFAGAVVENIPGMQWVNTIDSAIKTLGEYGTEDGMSLEEMVRAGQAKAMGVKTKKYVFTDDFWRTSRNDRNSLTSAHTDMRKQIITSDAKTYEEFRDEYRIKNAQRQQAFESMHNNVNNVREILGVTTLEIQREWQKAGISTSVAEIPAGHIMSGTYVPIQPVAVLKALNDERKRQIKDGESDPLTRERIIDITTWYRDAMLDREDL